MPNTRPYLTVARLTSLCKNQLKITICKLVDLEIKVIKSVIATHFCEAAVSLTIACAVSSPTIEDHLADDLVLYIFDEHPETLLRHSKSLKPKPFLRCLKLLPYTRPPPMRQLSQGQFQTTDQNALRPNLEGLPCSQGPRRGRHPPSRLRRKLQIAATESVPMELDTIPTDSPALKNLIDSRISTKEKIINKIISRLTNQVNSAIKKT
jgi:hypothetical protein